MEQASINLKHERYLDAKREGKSVEECVKAALPGADPQSKRFKWWLAKAETDISEIKLIIEFEELNKKAAAKEAAAKKAAAKEAAAKKAAAEGK